MLVDSFKSKDFLRNQIKSANESHKNRKYILRSNVDDGNDYLKFSEEEYNRYFNDLDYEEEFVKKYFDNPINCYIEDLQNYDNELPILSDYDGSIRLCGKEDYIKYIDSLFSDENDYDIDGEYGSIYDWYPIYDVKHNCQEEEVYILYCINRNNSFYHKVLIPYVDINGGNEIFSRIIYAIDSLNEHRIIDLDQFLENYENGNLPLKYFASIGNFEKVKELIETKNIDFNFTDDFYGSEFETSALDEAIVNYSTHENEQLYYFDDQEKLKNKDKCEILKLLIKNGAYTLGRLYRCDLFILDLFIQAGISKEKLLIDLINYYGHYINHQKNLLILVKELIRNGVSLNNIGRKALLLAINRNFYGIVEELLENGIVIDISEIVDIKKDMKELLMKYCLR